MRIYVAGPFTPLSDDKHKCIHEASQNVHRAIRVALKLIEKGHYPFVPHLGYYIQVNPAYKKDLGQEFFYAYDNTFLDYWAEALFYIAPSFGTDNELIRADKLGLIIYYSLEDVPDLRGGNDES